MKKKQASAEMRLAMLTHELDKQLRDILEQTQVKIDAAYELGKRDMFNAFLNALQSDLRHVKGFGVERQAQVFEVLINAFEKVLSADE